MLGLKTGISARRHRGKQVDVVHATDGKRLRVMKYRMPELEYSGGQCGPRALRFVDLEYLTQLLWACCVDVPVWRRMLDEMDPGLPGQIRAEFESGGNWQGFSGRRLESLIVHDATDGLLPILLRAPFLREDQRGEFMRSWLSTEGRKRLARFARYIPQERPSPREDEALKRILKTQFGLSLLPDLTPGASHAMRGLHDLAFRSSGLIREKPPQRMRTDREFEDDQTKKREGCRGCSN